MATVKIKPDQSTTNQSTTGTTVRKDSSPSVLVEGTGTPYIALFTEEGDPVLNSITGIPLGAYMTSFEVKLGEGEDDVGRIVLDTGDPDTVDIEDIQEGKTLNVQWGYIYPNGSSLSSKVHSLEIKQRDVVFDDQGTHVTLSVKDAVSNLRQDIPYRATGDDSQSIIDFLDNGLGQDRSVIIEMFE